MYDSNIDNNWHSRELNRIMDGTYRPLPAECWDMPTLGEHFVHMSNTKPGLIAYTPGEEAGKRDKQKATSVEAYVMKHFKERFDPSCNPHDLSRFGPEHIKRWTNAIKPADEHWLFYAKTADEIERVYIHGPGFGSCMRHGASHFETGGIHPVRVYGDSDLQIACMVPSSVAKEDTQLDDVLQNMTARCLVWPERKLRNRIFSDDNDAANEMAHLLKVEGYKSSDLYGAKLRRIETKWHSIIVPYLDCAECVEEYDDNWIITSDSGLGARCTEGVVEEHAENNRWMCEQCEETFSENECMNTVRAGYDFEHWCDHCVVHHSFYCEGTDTHFSSREFSRVEVDGRDYEAEYAADHFSYCEFDEEYTSEDTVQVNVGFSRYPSHIRSLEVQHWSESNANAHAVQCEHTEEWFADDFATLMPVIDQDGDTIMIPDVQLHEHDVVLVDGTLYFDGAQPDEFQFDPEPIENIFDSTPVVPLVAAE